MKKRLLLITPRFYGIEATIKARLEDLGFEVVWFENKTIKLDFHGTQSKFKTLRRFYFLLFAPDKRVVKKELSKIEDIRFDILFSINGHVICRYLFKKLRNKNRKLYSVLYLWDSFKMYSWTREIKYFDKVYTFDHADADMFGFEYKPNFYIKSNIKDSHVKDYDLFFVGKFSPFRLRVIDSIMNQIKESALNYYIKLWPEYKIYLHNWYIYSVLKSLRFNSRWVKNYIINFEAIEGIMVRDYIMRSSLSYKEIQEHLLCSNVILDLPFPAQTGYSHRLIEALANGKKVITTNSNIKKEIFYNPEKIAVMDNQNPEIDSSWISIKSTLKTENYFRNLELSKWLNSIINVEFA